MLSGPEPRQGVWRPGASQNLLLGWWRNRGPPWSPVYTLTWAGGVAQIPLRIGQRAGMGRKMAAICLVAALVETTPLLNSDGKLKKVPENRTLACARFHKTWTIWRLAHGFNGASTISGRVSTQPWQFKAGFYLPVISPDSDLMAFSVSEISKITIINSRTIR